MARSSSCGTPSSPARRTPRCVPTTTAGMPIEAYTEAIEDARVAAERDFGLVLRWIYDIPGEFGLPAADATLDYALRPPARRRWSASASAAPRSAYPRPQFQPHFDAARAAGLHSVPHAGETTGPRDRLGRARGCSAPSGSGTAPRPRRTPSCWPTSPSTGIPLEVCPSSNLATRAVATLEEHPLPGVPRRRRDGDDQLRRPADVRHHAEPGVRDRRRPARPRRGRRRRPRPDRGRASFADDDVKARILAEIDAYAHGAGS